MSMQTIRPMMIHITAPALAGFSFELIVNSLLCTIRLVSCQTCLKRYWGESEPPQAGQQNKWSHLLVVDFF